jgi:hypothetical protein
MFEQVILLYPGLLQFTLFISQSECSIQIKLNDINMEDYYLESRVALIISEILRIL